MTKQPTDFDRHLDTSGLLCPYPLLETKKTLHQLQTGQVLKITTTDPASVIDFKTFAAISPHELLHYDSPSKGTYAFWLKKG
jgi:tRNA 2-thiouridine synthesizing protein A